jgi:hypothetical protein
MRMMSCTAQIVNGRLHIGLPQTAFEHAVRDFRAHTDAKVWIPDPNVIEVSNIVIEFRIKREVEI